ncbi:MULTISPECIES: nucleoside diphosphate kinase regulator [unclassified Methylophilus]|jgi:regulator of nucleoside diphosphate kinase|uniref:nucleoside diphosphate kinase regulator n=1 Tax=unclassified Methylophilus TaxID=2630143 RepID=UPI0006F3C4E5|nr:MULTISPECIES: nucleoside diphosphate kinase regulator [unclassified Methylophilus]KQT36037.1 transcription elongation factor GreAB [Methylophilus sp. Leaf414]KQT42458.1 transcription elongation factor GreAB [Methylophilus sp. Leaf416]KQT56641.1 transcription elongation factor GreAB [Methylophilus sp. Leaf459]
MESENLILSEQDYARLSLFKNDALLRDELGRAVVVSADQMPDNVVRMHSRVIYLDKSNGLQREVELCFPEEADFKSGKISVFSPVGTALIGLKVGHEIEWPFPNGESRRLEVVEVTHAP